ncbi:MAG: cysteine desulfurase family protein [Gammaproteobacteria bacterium]|nr:cysteine desulfurase family protein [Gammaproteobacteria bacterium]
MAIYLDHNATTPLHEKVLEAMLPYMGGTTGNPSSLHRFGRLQRHAIDQAREQIAALMDAQASQVVFTSGGTEANNLMLKGLCKDSAVQRIAVSEIEHSSLLQPAAVVVDEGCAVDSIAVNPQGQVTPEALIHAIKDDTALVSVMAANNETGALQDIEKLAKEARSRGVWFHTDAAQVAGKMEFSFRQAGVHAMTLSAHKLYGPMGAGALIVDRQLPMHSILQGGSQENGLRAGTENVPAIVGFGMAAELARQEIVQRADHVRVLRDQLEKRLMQFGVVTVFAQQVQRLPNTLQFGVQGFDGETLLMELDRRGFAVSSGSACTSGKSEPSHVLKAMAVPDELATSAIRVSLGRSNTMAEIDLFVEAVQQIIGIQNSAVMMSANL